MTIVLGDEVVNGKYDMKNLFKCLDLYLKSKDAQNIAVRVGNRDEVFCEVYKYSGTPIDGCTLFDMASVTKIAVTTTLALMALDCDLIQLNDPIFKFFEVPDDKREITIKHLLTHTIGIGYKNICKLGVNYDNVQNYIVTIPSDIEIGSDVLYSCPGYILLGKVLEKVFGNRLDVLFAEKIGKPLGMRDSSFLPEKRKGFVNSNLGNEKVGIVNDYNCNFLGGVAGNAGLFSNMNDMCRYVEFLLNYGEPLIKKETFNKAIQNYTGNMSVSRGLGFLYVDEKYKQTGNLFSNGSVGHCGHTGQSVFVDLKRGLYCVILSDATVSTVKKYGDEKYSTVIKMREDIHNAIYCDLKKYL